MDIYNYLKKDHKLVSDLMKRLVQTQDASERKQLFQQIDEELTLHAKTEEKTFYAALEQKGGKQLQEKEEHAEEEHDEVRSYLKKLRILDINSDDWLINFGGLKHAVEHHVEEEEGEIFEKAKKVINDTLAEKLAEDMDALKQREKTKLHPKAA